MSYGYASVGHGMLVRPDTAFAIGSITKQFVAALVLRLCEGGTLALDDSLVRWVPETGSRGESIRLAHLLSHTSGIRIESELRLARGESTTLKEISSEVACSARSHLPGERWFYSSVGYFLLGAIVERASGSSLAGLLTSELLEPLHLRNTFFLGDRREYSAAVGHVRASAGFASVDRPTASSFASGNLYSSAEDLLSWTEALAGGRVLRPESLALMTAPVQLSSGLACQYGLGTFVASLSGHREWSHDGATAGFSSSLAHYPDDELTVVVLTNGARHCSERIEKQVTRLLLGLPAETPPAALADEPISCYAGTYWYGLTSIPVVARDPHLLLRTPAGRVAELVPVAHATFRELEQPELEYRFERLSEGRERLQVSREGKLLAVASREPD